MKKSTIHNSLIAIVTANLLACAHYPDVRPAANGPHSASFLTDEKDEGFKNAFAQAKDYCDDVYKKRPKVVSESSEYIGSMSESSYNAARTTSKIVSGVGVAGVALGGKNERKAGGAAAAGGGIASGAISQGYRYTLKFTCE